MKKTIYILFLLFSTYAFSQSLTGEDDYYNDYQKVDKELNSVYNKLKNGLGIEDKKALVEAQKAWIKFRDLNCKFQSKDHGTIGPYENKVRLDCLIKTTLARTKELENLIEGL